MKKDSPLDNAIRMLDLKLDTLEDIPVSKWTAEQKKALYRMGRKVSQEWDNERFSNEREKNIHRQSAQSDS